MTNFESTIEEIFNLRSESEKIKAMALEDACIEFNLDDQKDVDNIIADIEQEINYLKLDLENYVKSEASWCHSDIEEDELIKVYNEAIAA